MSERSGMPIDTDKLDKVLVRNILEHALDYTWMMLDYTWMMQDIGLLGLRLDEHRAYRLHVWAPDHCLGPPVIHDHPFDFVSRIIAGELTNVRYVEDPSGVKYQRDRYSPSNEGLRTMDTLQLVGTAETYREDDEYAQLAHELHDSHQLPGTVTILRRRFQDVNELTVCRPEDAPWLSGLPRQATGEEVQDVTSVALSWF